MNREQLATHDKALVINLDPHRYGSFAEIGAGQEVVRWFFQVGGAAGTIAKSISAYDMTVSDAIYGKCERYVCRSRLQSMLEYEQNLNLERLHPKRGDTTAFFSFADTVSARNFQGTNECHGWMGIRFQAHTRDEDSQIIIHVRMLDSTNTLQQEALGIVGVNLIHAACCLYYEPDQIVESLLDNLSTDRIEIDMIEFSGIEFRHVDNRLMALKLVQLGVSNAAMFAADGAVMQPSEILYKRPILVERGSFRPVTHTNLDILDSAVKTFRAEEGIDPVRVIHLMEITMNNLMATGSIDHQDFLARADMLCACGMTVLISNYFEYFRLAAYLTRYTRESIGLTMGAANLAELFNEKYYTNLDGGILESFGRLFKNDLKLYIYPWKRDGKLVTAANLEVPDELRLLYDYLRRRGCIEDLENYREDCLDIRSSDILRMIETGDSSWEKMVPEEVERVIKDGNLFAR